MNILFFTPKKIPTRILLFDLESNLCFDASTATLPNIKSVLFTLPGVYFEFVSLADL